MRRLYCFWILYFANDHSYSDELCRVIELFYAMLVRYGGSFGGFSAAGMTMVPMMMPGGQVAYVMAAPSGGVGAPLVSHRQQPPPPMEPPLSGGSGGPARRNTVSPRGARIRMNSLKSVVA